MRSNKTLASILIPILLAGWTEPVPAQDRITPLEQSRIWIEGRSNVNNFVCHAEEFDGVALYRSGQVDPETGSLTVELEIPVRYLDCGRSRMNRDMNEALKSDRFETIRFEFSDAAITEGSGSGDDPFRLIVDGRLQVAGVEREVQFRAEGILRNSGVVQIRGEKRIRMTDYEVEPPVGLLGLVRAQDELTVHFDIHAEGMNTAEPQTEP